MRPASVDRYPELLGVHAAEVGLLGELRIAPTATCHQTWWPGSAGLLSRSPDYYDRLPSTELLADAWRRVYDLSVAQCSPDRCQATARYRAADYLLNRAVRLADCTFAGALDPVLREFIDVAARVIVRQLVHATHEPAAHLGSLDPSRPVPPPPDRTDAETRVVVEGDNHYMTLSAGTQLLQAEAPRYDLVVGPLLGAGAVVPLWAELLGVPWDYCRVSLYHDAMAHHVLPRLSTGLRVLVVDDNAGSGRTLAAIRDSLQLLGCHAELRCVELHYEKFRRDPAASLLSITEHAPDLLGQAPWWAYRHHAVTADLVGRHRDGMPGGPSTADWWRVSLRLRSAYVDRSAPRSPSNSRPSRTPSSPDLWTRSCPSMRL